MAAVGGAAPAVHGSLALAALPNSHPGAPQRWDPVALHERLVPQLRTLFVNGDRVPVGAGGSEEGSPWARDYRHRCVRGKAFRI